jgi:hypothetical protein
MRENDGGVAGPGLDHVQADAVGGSRPERVRLEASGQPAGGFQGGRCFAEHSACCRRLREQEHGDQ